MTTLYILRASAVAFNTIFVKYLCTLRCEAIKSTTGVSLRCVLEIQAYEHHMSLCHEVLWFVCACRKWDPRSNLKSSKNEYESDSKSRVTIFAQSEVHEYFWWSVPFSVFHGMCRFSVCRQCPSSHWSWNQPRRAPRRPHDKPEIRQSYAKRISNNASRRCKVIMKARLAQWK